jgi:uncharacterized protein YjbI with pentapeptide repeats
MADAFSYRGFIIEVDAAVLRVAIDGSEVPKEKVEAQFVRSKLSGDNTKALRQLAKKIVEDSPEFGKRKATRLAHLAILKKGAGDWNKWRKENPEIRPLLYEANLSRKAFPVDLRSANFANANLINAKLIGVDLEGANFHEANLKGAILHKAHLKDANFCRADLYETDLSNAKLINANLQGTQLAKTIFKGAHITECKVYGMSAWDLNLKDAKQRDLIIRYRHASESKSGEGSNEDQITVYDLRVAQFIYLLLNNKNIRTAIDTITWKTVLILGRFTPERKKVLDSLRKELRKRGLVPILFDFEKPQSRNLTETVSTLAHMARFVIADLTDAKSIPQELQRIIPDLPSLPVQPIILDSQYEYAMFSDFLDSASVLKPHRYANRKDLLQSLAEKVIAPAEAKAREIIERRKMREEEMKR